MSRLLVRWSGRTRLLTSSSGMPSNLSCFFLSLYVFARFLASASSALRKKKKKEYCEGLNNTAGFLYAASYDSARKTRAAISLDRQGTTVVFFHVCFLPTSARVLDSLQCFDSWHRNAMLHFIENSYCEYARIIHGWISWYLARYKTTVDAIYGCYVFKRNRLTQ